LVIASRRADFSSSDIGAAGSFTTFVVDLNIPDKLGKDEEARLSLSGFAVLDDDDGASVSAKRINLLLRHKRRILISNECKWLT
jgi:hypothetical protein